MNAAPRVPGPVDDPLAVGGHEHIEWVEVGVQQRRARKQRQVGVIVDVSRPPLLGLLHRKVRAAYLLEPVDDLDDGRQVR
jgi:hypothetical protein